MRTVPSSWWHTLTLSTRDMLARTRSLCDTRFRLRLEQVGDRLVKLLEVLKVRGADRTTGDVVSFDIEPRVGMRIIPLAKARV